MEFENLVWIIIIILAYGMSVIFKKVRSQPTPGKKGKTAGRPGWKEKLDRYLLQVRQELKAATQDDSRRETGWERVLPQEDADAEAAEEMDIPHAPARAMVGRASPPTGSDPIRRDISPQEKEPLSEDRFSPSLKPAGSGKKRRPENLPYGIEDLRRAVIWSEILAPPIALRDR